jgi:hypothetical protein
MTGVKVMLPCAQLRTTPKARRSGVQTGTFLTSALHVAEWSAVCPKMRPEITHWINSLMMRRVSLEAAGKKLDYLP